ncbi:helix-turn-helix domain-containing protein [Natrarchaeobaculum sulfurireducens]|uniref:helix-turn-helix domain-containing protein n=1 Tax=Natrarchaeobaculum sulfurireducens TaxID=2044521 RepID=UPI000E3DFBA7
MQTLEWFISTEERKDEDITRVRILLKADDGFTDSQVSEHVGCHWKTAYNTRKAYAERGLGAIHHRYGTGKNGFTSLLNR